MNKDEAIQDLESYIRWAKLDQYPYVSQRRVEAINMAIKALEEHESKWISISKGLPKENGWYQCTIISNDLPQTMELFYKNGKWLDNRRIDMFNTYDIYGYGNTEEKHKLSYQELISEFDWTENVIAWKPLSGPYISDTDDGKITESEEEK